MQICAGCGRDDVALTWRKVEGWERHRDQGGTNHLAGRRTRDEYLCDSCMFKVRTNVSLAQGQLL